MEIIFEVTEDPIDRGFVASALGHGITTEADTLTDLRHMVRDAVQCHFHDAEQMPKIIRLHFVRDEVMSLSRRKPANQSAESTRNVSAHSSSGMSSKQC